MNPAFQLVPQEDKGDMRHSFWDPINQTAIISQDPVCLQNVREKG